jgi:SAM-dependent methyltransferase
VTAPSELRFFEYMKFDSAWIQQGRAFYVPMFEGRERVLDVACGRGEFLLALGRGSGVDIESGMVAAARDSGLDVAEGDAFAFLRDRPGAFDGIFSAHFVEHLTYEQAAELARLAYRALVPGGVLVMCTPNAASLPTLQRQFWWDATHVRMYDVHLLEFMLLESGFADVEGGVNPRAMPGCPIDLEALRIPDIEPIARPRLLSKVFGLLDRRTQETHHHLTVVANSLRGFLTEVYTSSEVYVRGVKP